MKRKFHAWFLGGRGRVNRPRLPGAKMSTPNNMAFMRARFCWLLLMVTSGCAAIGARERDGAGHSFAGVRDDWHYLVHPSEADVPALQPLNIIDVPFSCVVDFVCWPYDSATTK